MRRGYDPGYGSREQLKDCVEQGMKAARERDALKTENAKLQDRIIELETIIKYNLKTENAALLDRINKLTWQCEQYKTLLVCMRHFMNCDGANECRTCVVTADMYLELMA
jgi:hypothetical protein